MRLIVSFLYIWKVFVEKINWKGCNLVLSRNLVVFMSREDLLIFVFYGFFFLLFSEMVL